MAKDAGMVWPKNLPDREALKPWIDADRLPTFEHWEQLEKAGPLIRVTGDAEPAIAKLAPALADSQALFLTTDCGRPKSKPDFFDQLADDLRLPDYFGKNWDALDECLTDYGFLDEDPIVILFKNFLPFQQRDPREASILLSICNSGPADYGPGFPEKHIVYVVTTG